MRVRKTELQTKEVEVTIEDYIVCDKCNKKISNNPYDAFEFKLEYRKGVAFPEGSGGEKGEMEICNECANDCVKLLEDNGYRINYDEWEC